MSNYSMKGAEEIRKKRAAAIQRFIASQVGREIRLKWIYPLKPSLFEHVIEYYSSCVRGGKCQFVLLAHTWIPRDPIVAFTELAAVRMCTGCGHIISPDGCTTVTPLDVQTFENLRLFIAPPTRRRPTKKRLPLQ